MLKSMCCIGKFKYIYIWRDVDLRGFKLGWLLPCAQSHHLDPDLSFESS